MTLDGGLIAADQISVLFEPGFSRSDADQFMREQGLGFLYRFGAWEGYLFSVPEGVNIIELRARLARQPRVLAASFNSVGNGGVVGNGG